LTFTNDLYNKYCILTRITANYFASTRGKEIRLSLWGTTVWKIDEDLYKNNPAPFALVVTSTIVKTFNGKHN
jgi:hypothetical protein